MATIPRKEEVTKLTKQSDTADEKKAASQEKQQKDFVNSGQGVIPETVWKNLPGKAQ